jgi:hypothetical protein
VRGEVKKTKERKRPGSEVANARAKWRRNANPDYNQYCVVVVVKSREKKKAKKPQ